jgi:transcriptional regulator
MYLPSHFAEERLDVLHDAIRAHPFATLITQGANGVTADHLPFLLQALAGKLGTLQAHLARANPAWQAATDVLVIFHGPHAYISPSWYPTKQEHGKVVPTWNYQVVHACGQLRVIDDADWKRSLVDRLTRQHEATLPEPWQVADAPPDYIDRMLPAIVGIEIEITALQGKFKMSQNQPEVNRGGVIAGLAGLAGRDDRNGQELATQMTQGQRQKGSDAG